MRMMDLDDLHIFRSVVREGGVTRAAERLHRVPSNVTTRIRQLEGRLGVTLFQRQGRTLALTPAGNTLLDHAERLLKMADLAEQEVRGGAMSGVLRLGSL
ncbi:MAG: LysR family transcriptional regulator, partial [Deltaproteobacteria bacterium]